MILRRHGRSLWLVLLTTLVNIGLAVPATRYGAAFILLWLLPGLAYARLLAGRHRRPTAEEVAVGLGLGMGTVVLLTLLLHYIPGPLTLPALLTAVNMLIFILILILAIPRPPLLDFKDAVGELGFLGMRPHKSALLVK